MDDGEPGDAELEAIRARRREEVIARARRDTAPAVEPAVPVELTGGSLPEFLRSHPQVVIDVWAPWCAPCRLMAPIVEAAARAFAPGVRFGKVNADHEPAWTARWGVQGIPTLLFFRNGLLVDRLVGAQPAEVLAARLRSTFRIGAEADVAPGIG